MVLERELIKTLLLSVITLLSFPSICCSNLGSGNCLSSRLEHVPCHYRHPTSTRKPGRNEIGEYLTRFNGGYNCEIIRRRHRVSPIPQIPSNDGSVFYIYSPGKRYITPAKYNNQKLVLYNVNCSAGQLIYFQIIDMDIESTKCFDSIVDRNKCVDYVQVRTPQGDVISDNCGGDKTKLDGVVLPFDSIQVIFRSSVHSRYTGFTAIAQCFTPIQPTGCYVTTTRTDNTQKCQGSAYEKIEIPYGHDLTIQGATTYSKLSIRDRLTNRISTRLTKSSFQSLDFHAMDGTLEHFENPTQKEYNLNPEEGITRHNDFYRSQLTSIPNQFQGPGILYIPRDNNNGHTCFQNYLVDVSRYTPTLEEKEIIKQLSKALDKLIEREEPPTDGPILTDELDLAITRGSDEIIIPTKPVNIFLPTEPVEIILPIKPIRELDVLSRHKRFVLLNNRKTDRIDQNTLFSAVKNDGACNPVLRGSASTLVRALKKENPAQLRKFQESALQLDERVLQNYQ